MRGNPRLVKLWGLSKSFSNTEDVEEPFAYRAWKWLLQHKPAIGGDRDLFDRLDATDWDVLILLDACRYDVLADVAETAVVDCVRSPASATPEFLSKAGRRGVFDGTTYVSGNPQTEDATLGSDVRHVPVYSDQWDEQLSTVRPDAIYDEVADAADDDRRVVAHTLQPHFPHICRIDGQTIPVPNGVHPNAHGGDGIAGNSYQAMLASGRLDLRNARRSYAVSTKFAWDRASAFAARLAGRGNRVVISSDHGELFGEYGLVEHPMNVRLATVERVPWVVFEPDSDVDRTDGVSERLAALGYV